ncbi:MAG: hypothetical protein HXX11_10610 [Desulfuromonadales bacterium]|nr:hypothetical protein [Desulfuromonadales bacterium]
MVRILAHCVTLIVLIAFPVVAADAAPFAYITNNISDSVSVIDTATNSVVTTIPVGDQPQAIAVNPAGTRVYVVNFNADYASVIDTATNTVVSTIPVGWGAVGAVVNPTGTRVYVVNYSNTVSVIDTATNAVIGNPIPVGSSPEGIAVNQAGTRVYVANNHSDSVSVIDVTTNNVVGTIPLQMPRSLAVTPAGTRVYVVNGGNEGSVIDTSTNTVVGTFPSGNSSEFITLNPAGTRAYVTNYDSATVTVIDTTTNTLVTSISVGQRPIGIAVNPAGSRVFVANSYSNTVSVIDAATNMVINTISVGNGAFAFGQFIGPEQPPVLSGLVSLWHAQGNGLDSYGSNNSDSYGGATFAPGISGQAFSLNGSSQYVQDAAPKGLPTGNMARTVAAWIKSVGPTSGTKYQTVVGYGTPGVSGLPDGRTFFLEWGGDVNNRHLYLTGWNTDLAGSTLLDYGQWYHVAATYDGTDVKLYVNGQLDANAPRALNTAINGSGLMIGNAPANDGWHANFNGLIDEVQIFNRALSATEIARIYGRIPDPVVFTPQTNAVLNSLVESNSVTVTGIGFPTLIDISGGEYSVSTSGSSSWSAWTNSSGTVNSNDRVRVRRTASGAYSTQTSATVTIGGVTGVFTVTTIPPPSFAITTSVPAGHGTVSCASPIILGASSTCVITPDAGYHTASLTDNSADVLAAEVNGQYTIANVTAAHALVASFAINSYPVSATVNGGHGTMICTTPVDHGGLSVCTVTPDAGYHAASLTDNGVDVSTLISNSHYSVSTVTAAHELVAVFAINSYTINASVTGGHGTIACTSPVEYGGFSTCVITPDTGYHLASLADNEADVVQAVSGGQYTISNVTSGHAVVGAFAVSTYTVSATVAGGHGTIECTSPVIFGGSSTCTIIPDPSYHLMNLTDNGPSVLTSAINGQYVISNVAASHTVVASFGHDPLAITVNPGNGGTIACSDTTVAYGGNATCFIVPSAGNRIHDVLVDSENRGANPIVTFTNVTANHTISAVFNQIPQSGPASRPTNLQAWWRGGNSALDVTGRYDGVASSGVASAEGMVGDAFSLDGNSHISVPDGIILNTSRSFTVNAWVHPVSAESEQVVFHGGSAGGEYALMVSSGFYYFAVHLNDDNPDESWQIVAAPVTVNGWALVTGVRRGTVLEIWVNGVMLGNSTIPDLDLWVASVNPSHSNIGAMIGEADIFFTGLIDELQLYSRALTAGEITSIYNAGSIGMSENVTPQPTLSVSVDGSGSGTVTSVPTGISCTRGTKGTCSAFFDALLPVTLIPTPDGDSLFSGWSGACTATSGNCSVIMGSDSSVGATFSLVLPARIQGGGDYPHIRDAYTALSADGTILARQFQFDGGLSLDLGWKLFLKGGYNTAYTENSGYSTIAGILTVRTGSLAVERVMVK